MFSSDLASSYAALILADDGVDITADKLHVLIKAANVEDVEPIWTTLFAKALEGKDTRDIVAHVNKASKADINPAACKYPFQALVKGGEEMLLWCAHKNKNAAVHGLLS